MTVENKNSHLAIIKDKFNSISAQLIKKLKQFNFIKSTKDEILSADKFYDPTEKFFKIIYRNDIEKYPNQPYDTNEWIEFLGGIGLKGIDSLNEF